jgi:hypothetical protein
MPSFFKLDDYPNTNIFELGCGNGRNLLEIQAALPSSKLTCMNKAGWGLYQSESIQDLIQTALHCNITLHCNIESSKPILPSLMINNGLQAGPIPVPDQSFDLIISLQALSEGYVICHLS